MSANKLIVSANAMKGGSQADLAAQLLDANNVAIKIAK